MIVILLQLALLLLKNYSSKSECLKLAQNCCGSTFPLNWWVRPRCKLPE